VSVNDDWGPLRDSERLILEALRMDVPVFGHCLGGQLMSRAMGGQVSAAPLAEIGWSQVDAQGDPLAQHWLADPASRCFNGTTKRSACHPPRS
jgi:GMP synthase-like glutamine amidotransferase